MKLSEFIKRLQEVQSECIERGTDDLDIEIDHTGLTRTLSIDTVEIGYSYNNSSTRVVYIYPETSDINNLLDSVEENVRYEIRKHI